MLKWAKHLIALILRCTGYMNVYVYQSHLEMVAVQCNFDDLE